MFPDAVILGSQMAQARLPSPVLLVVAVFSRHDKLFAYAVDHLEKHFGPVGLASLPYEFEQTSYYEATMGKRLKKQLFAFDRLIDAGHLAETKRRTNEFEQAVANLGTYSEPRPLNLDPGILSLGKFMLATTKDQAHRIYLSAGIYAEVTLRFQAGTFEPWPWTYADYRLPVVISFLNSARDFFRQKLRERPRKDA